MKIFTCATPLLQLDLLWEALRSLWKLMVRYVLVKYTTTRIIWSKVTLNCIHRFAVDLVVHDSVTSVINDSNFYTQIGFAQMVPYHPFLLLKSGKHCKSPCQRSNGEVKAPANLADWEIWELENRLFHLKVLLEAFIWTVPHWGFILRINFNRSASENCPQSCYLLLPFSRTCRSKNRSSKCNNSKWIWYSGPRELLCTRRAYAKYHVVQRWRCHANKNNHHRRWSNWRIKPGTSTTPRARRLQMCWSNCCEKWTVLVHHKDS